MMMISLVFFSHDQIKLKCKKGLSQEKKCVLGSGFYFIVIFKQVIFFNFSFEKFFKVA
jgi:hypothetical protein